MVASPPMGLSSGWGAVMTIRMAQALRLPRLPRRALPHRAAHLLEFNELAAGRVLRGSVNLRGVLSGKRIGVTEGCWLANAIELRGHPRRSFGCWFEFIR